MKITKKIEKVVLIILISILLITISGIGLTFIKFENNKKKYNEELINNNLCSRKTFSEQLEYLANEQAVFYNLDNNNIYKDTIDTSQNKFKEYMESQGWNFDVERSADYLSEIVEVKLMKNNVTVFFKAQKDLGIQRYYDFSAIVVEDEQRKGGAIFTETSRDTLDISIKSRKKITLNYADTEKKQEKKSENTFKEFITDIQSYSEEICISSSEDRLEI